MLTKLNNLRPYLFSLSWVQLISLMEQEYSLSIELTGSGGGMIKMDVLGYEKSTNPFRNDANRLTLRLASNQIIKLYYVELFPYTVGTLNYTWSKTYY